MRTILLLLLFLSFLFLLRAWPVVQREPKRRCHPAPNLAPGIGLALLLADLQLPTSKTRRAHAA